MMILNGTPFELTPTQLMYLNYTFTTESMDIHVLANNMYDFKKNTRHMYKQIGITTKPVFLRKVGKDQISVMILKTTLLPPPSFPNCN